MCPEEDGGAKAPDRPGSMQREVEKARPLRMLKEWTLHM